MVYGYYKIRINDFFLNLRRDFDYFKIVFFSVLNSNASVLKKTPLRVDTDGKNYHCYDLGFSSIGRCL